ncbi:MAG: IPTL-CTERM sorting domain-containing protein [Desulfobacterales bacterium]|nr:IPTL-CTERM sorting domain-containing protein [Desulfobacterales bacterium]
MAVNVTGGATATVSFGDQQPVPATGSITGLVFYDINGNGVQDAGEPALPGVTITLRNSANAVVATTTTDANGNYSFANLPPGQYTVSQTVPPGFVGSTNTTVPVTVTPEGAATAVFGDVQGGAVPVPTMTEWGMMLFVLIAGGISAYRLRRQSAFLSGA